MGSYYCFYGGHLTGEGVDYGYSPPRMYNFTFPAGVTCATPDASIPIIDDSISENNEMFYIVILNNSLPYGIKFGSTNRAKVTIEDNDSK